MPATGTPAHACDRYLEIGENRPRMLHVSNSTDVLLENMFFKNPPYWTTLLEVNGLEVRYCTIDAWRISPTTHTAVDLTAFNTDGFDVKGRNIWIHHCSVWNQDVSAWRHGLELEPERT